MTARTANGFTLLELLVAIGLIGTLACFLVGGLVGGGQTAALQSGQATLANLVTAARTKAIATGRKTRLLVNIDPAVPDRFLRHIVLQLARETGASPADWDTVIEVFLPEGIHVVPALLSGTGGLVANPADWKRVSDPSMNLASDLFANQSAALRLAGDASAQAWTGFAFTPNGTLAALDTGPPPKGNLLITAGARRSPGSYLAGEAPVQLTNAQAVRGLILSVYGVPALLNDRNAF